MPNSHPFPSGPLARYLLQIADDQLIMGHRNSEWTGLGPMTGGAAHWGLRF